MNAQILPFNVLIFTLSPAVTDFNVHFHDRTKFWSLGAKLRKEQMAGLQRTRLQTSKSKYRKLFVLAEQNLPLKPGS
ncbi:uncharacterized protein PHALS_01889 [Plasmopara halstedii]|uniref:Uncharacterized protein n=1 Tax=Plasmopara halstedii TaxID=4781 RepID=A0A0P1A6M7_PLAHL|nr:uncharacterized protein PHALS_01889 [Plasmopara halstedii]CEG36250.1 hypothetical protein PHALS_01889 [Plasmopara halstedii]|eukprot:XP_024572619.1 hypothetical protein PHALS_01889 [Plasmopara halstedii]